MKGADCNPASFAEGPNQPDADCAARSSAENPQMAKDLFPSRDENEHLSPTRFEVVLPADVSAISPVVSWVMRLVGELEYAAGKEFEIELALREALANAIVHGCKGDPAQKIVCTVAGDKNRGI